MENSQESRKKEASANSGLQIIRHPAYQPNGKLLLPWFDIRVFYVRISNFAVDGYTPEHLTLRHVPLSPDTVLEINGSRCSVNSEGATCRLRRNRVDKKFEEVTFVSTDNIRLTGSVKFEVFDGEDFILRGVLEMAHCNGVVGEYKKSVRKWNMKCESMVCVGTKFLQGKQIGGSYGSLVPTIEVYVAGSFSATPIILTKTLQINLPNNINKKDILDSIPECETRESWKDVPSGFDLQMAEYRKYKTEGEESDYGKMYWRHREEYMDMEGEEGGELSWFNAGVRVGVGLGLGICLGVGIGVGLLVRTYHSTTRNFRRHLP